MHQKQSFNTWMNSVYQKMKKWGPNEGQYLGNYQELVQQSCNHSKALSHPKNIGVLNSEYQMMKLNKIITNKERLNSAKYLIYYALMLPIKCLFSFSVLLPHFRGHHTTGYYVGVLL